MVMLALGFVGYAPISAYESEAGATRSGRKTAMGNTLMSQPAETKPRPKETPEQARRRLEKRKVHERLECVRKMLDVSPDVEFTEVVAVHKSWQNPLRVNNKMRVLVQIRPDNQHQIGKVLEFNERELLVKWDNGGEERYLRQTNNSYMLDSLVKSSDSSLTPPQTRAVKHLLSRKAVSWEEYGWFGRFMDFITGKEPPMTFQTFKLSGGKSDCTVRFAENEKVLVSMSKDHEPAKVLGYTGVKLHVFWQSGAVESYKRGDDGTYRMINDEQVALRLLDPDASSREKSEDDWFQIWWRDIMNEDKPLTYQVLELRKGKVDYRPRLSMDNLVLIHTPPHKDWGKVVQFDRRRLIVRWNGQDEELYERDADNVYHFVK